MNPYEQRIAAFYSAFRELDGAAMQAAYASDARFHDPAFRLKGRDEIGAMWRMLCSGVASQSRDVWRLDITGIHADEKLGRAHWEARYRFSATGRIVHNVIDAAFSFDERGQILTHRDSFDFWRWSRQAFGPTGLVLGWTPFFAGKVRARAKSNLAAFRQREAR